MTEIVLPRRVVPQPSPAVVKGGDCGACCIAGVFGISVEEAYELQDKDRRPDSAKNKPIPFSRSDMVHALHCYGFEPKRHDGIAHEVPMWPVVYFTEDTLWGFPSWKQYPAWWNYVRMGLCGEYYGICQVSIDGTGPLDNSNHWVTICGTREVNTPIEALPGASRIDKQILVSCSARHPDGKWMDAREFLTKYGGFNVIMVRPLEVNK